MSQNVPLSPVLLLLACSKPALDYSMRLEWPNPSTPCPRPLLLCRLARARRGYWLIGQRKRTITVGVTIIAIFVFGILISGIRVVQAPDMATPGGIVTKILSRPWFIGQVLNGPIGLAAAWTSDQLASSATYKTIEAKRASPRSERSTPPSPECSIC